MGRRVWDWVGGVAGSEMQLPPALDWKEADFH
jgi:hypothetical protein